MQTKSSCLTKGASSSAARTTSCWRRKGSMPSCMPYRRRGAVMPTMTVKQGIKEKEPTAPGPGRGIEPKQAGGKEIVRFLYRNIKPHRLTFMLVVCCTIVAIAADLLQPYLMK